MLEEWTLQGYDSFSDEFYSLPGKYPDEMTAKKEAGRKLQELERTQPTEDSGGQSSDLAIQDRIFIIRPDGTKYRYLPSDLF